MNTNQIINPTASTMTMPAPIAISARTAPSIPAATNSAGSPPARIQSAPTTTDLVRFEAEKKSAGVAVFLCWLLGTFGGHRFYLNRPHAATMLIITLISLPLCLVIIGFVGLFATWLWMIVDVFSVSRWVREHNTALLARIQADRG
jgi:TM2 domain-containing membrane protein YozV